jgi:hypothetical protein
LPWSRKDKSKRYIEPIYFKKGRKNKGQEKKEESDINMPDISPSFKKKKNKGCKGPSSFKQKNKESNINIINTNTYIYK